MAFRFVLASAGFLAVVLQWLGLDLLNAPQPIALGYGGLLFIGLFLSVPYFLGFAGRPYSKWNIRIVFMLMFLMLHECILALRR